MVPHPDNGLRLLTLFRIRPLVPGTHTCFPYVGDLPTLEK